MFLTVSGHIEEEKQLITVDSEANTAPDFIVLRTLLERVGQREYPISHSEYHLNR